MGIHGLTGFIDNNQHLLHQHQLHDCSVVIDGNNFYHYLYYACHVQCSFGGDYDVYRKKIISTFESLSECGIVPYVVMDGAYTVDGRKLKTSLSRATARIRLIDTMSNNQKGQALPALAYETFIQTLTEIGVHHATCQFEADNEIAVLANKLKCPVLSNDSDFYIFDLCAGFLPLDYLDFRTLKKQNPDGSNYCFLHCHIYHVDDFINSFDGLSRSVLPVFASLLGNDFINVSSFSTFYSRVKVPKIVSKKFKLPPRLSKVISVLHWLHSQHDDVKFADIKDELLAFIKPGKKEKVEKMFVSSVNGYVDVENFQGYDLHQYFSGDKDKCTYAASDDFCGYNGAAFPLWFMKSVCKGEITPYVMNVAILHRVIILAQVEDISLTTSYSCSAGLRQVLYGILLKDDQPGHNASEPICLTEDIPDSITAHGTFQSDVEDRDESVSESEVHRHVDASTCEGTRHHPSNHSSLDQLQEDSHLEVETAQTEDGLENLSEEEESIAEEDPEVVEIVEDKDMANSQNSKEGQTSIKQVCVEEYNRLNKNLQKSYVEPQYTVGDFDVPGLSELCSLSLETRQSVLLHALKVDQPLILSFSNDLQLFVACVLHWVHHADPKVTSNHLEAVIVGVILVKTLQFLAERKDKSKRDIDGDKEAVTGSKTSSASIMSQQETVREEEMACSSELDADTGKISIDKICAASDLQHLENLRQNLDKYHKKSPTFNRSHHYNPRVSHAFAQLQACMVDAINLNKVLRCPLATCRLSELINGTFLYNFMSELQTRAQPELFITAMLGKNSPLHKLFEAIKSKLISSIDQNSLSAPSNITKKSRKRKSKGKEKTESSSGTADGLTEDGGSLMRTVTGFDVANKFSVLTMCD